MTVHKHTRLLPRERRELVRDYYEAKMRVCDLVRKYRISAPTVYKIIRRAKEENDYSIRRSINIRYRCIRYGMKRLEKVEQYLEDRKRKQSRRYCKSYPGEQLHLDTKKLPLLTGESPREQKEYLFVGIDDFSRELYAGIFPDKTQNSSEQFLTQVLDECPYTIESVFTDNGKEYKGRRDHLFVAQCAQHNITQGFTSPGHPQSNGKAERVIRTLMDMWHNKTIFKSRTHRKQELIRFVNWYNTVKPHKSLNNNTPMEHLIGYFYPSEI